MSSRRPPRSEDSTEPLDVNRATNSTERRALARPEAVEWQEQLLASGFNVRLRNVERALIKYHSTYDEAHPDNGGFLAYLMSYLDPTGEQATDHVMAERIAS